VGVVGGVGALAGTLWYYFSGTKYLMASSSPSRQYRALITKERDQTDCGGSGSTFVVVERKTGFIKSGEMPLFCVSDEGARDLKIQWSGPSDCPQCGNGTFRFYNGRLGDFTFRLEH
jgi:hypothetical protein